MTNNCPDQSLKPRIKNAAHGQSSAQFTQTVPVMPAAACTPGAVGTSTAPAWVCGSHPLFPVRLKALALDYHQILKLRLALYEQLERCLMSPACSN